MKKHVSSKTRTILFSALTGLLALPSFSVRAEEPVPAKKEPVDKLCEIPGFYKEYPIGDGSLIVTCHLISSNACLYLPGPCPQGSLQEQHGRVVPAPPALKAEQGQKFFARYNENGELIVTYVKDYELNAKNNEDGSTTLILNYK